MAHRIHVTQEDIDKGGPGQYNNCPVVLAVKRELGAVRAFLVSYIAWTMPGESEYTCHFANKTDEVSRFVSNFDAKQPVKPFEFDLVELNLKQPTDV